MKSPVAGEQNTLSYHNRPVRLGDLGATVTVNECPHHDQIVVTNDIRYAADPAADEPKRPVRTLVHGFCGDCLAWWDPNAQQFNLSPFPRGSDAPATNPHIPAWAQVVFDEDGMHLPAPRPVAA